MTTFARVAPAQILNAARPLSRGCHPERSPARFCFSPDFWGRGAQFEGSASDFRRSRKLQVPRPVKSSGTQKRVGHKTASLGMTTKIKTHSMATQRLTSYGYVEPLFRAAGFVMEITWQNLPAVMAEVVFAVQVAQQGCQAEAWRYIRRESRTRNYSGRFMSTQRMGGRCVRTIPCRSQIFSSRS